ncbi:MAG TPA: MFS transporter [Elusimicrobiales bacterium]|nr:MFS transporter [Elusimicrobiales bacterium]
MSGPGRKGLETAEKKLSIKGSFGVLFGASRGFWLVNAVNFGDGIAYFGILTLLTRFLGTRVGMSDELTGLSVSFFTGLVTLFMFGGGFVSDRLGTRRAMTLSLSAVLAGRLLLLASPYLSAGTPRVAAALFALLVMAAGEGVIQPAMYAGTKEHTDERTVTLGYSFLYAIMNLGIIAENLISPFIRTSDVFSAPFLGAVFGLGLGIDGVYWFCTIITAVTLLNHLLFFTEKVEAGAARLQTPPEGERKGLRETLKSLPFADLRFMLFIFMLLPVRTLFAHQFLTLPDYVFRAFPEGVGARFEWIAGLNPLIIVIFVPLIAAMTENVRVLRMMIVGTTISALTTFLLVSSPDVNVLLLYVALFSLGEAVWSSRFLEYVADIAPKGQVGAYMGLAGVPWFMAKFTTGLYSGAMLNKYIPVSGAQDPASLWLIYALIACVTPAGLLLFGKLLAPGAGEGRK